MASSTLPRVQSVRAAVRNGVLDADLTIPEAASGLVIFAHGSGSGRHSPRNQFVARALNARRQATLLADLLTLDEEQADRVTAHLRFDIELLANRLLDLIDWADQNASIKELPVGLFGASTGAAPGPARSRPPVTPATRHRKPSNSSGSRHCGDRPRDTGSVRATIRTARAPPRSCVPASTADPIPG